MRGSNRFGAGGVWIKTFIPNYAHLKALLVVQVERPSKQVCIQIRSIGDEILFKTSLY